ncbi:MAG: DUF5522 domain-containing protein [Bacteroidota bacterium]|jgi:hypothetical protein
MQPLKEGIDFYYDTNGYMVFTEHYHLEKGYCCGHGCLHCPFDFENVPPSRRALLLKERKNAPKEKTDKKD